jgi:hypothetical protein
MLAPCEERYHYQGTSQPDCGATLIMPSSQSCDKSQSTESRNTRQPYQFRSHLRITPELSFLLWLRRKRRSYVVQSYRGCALHDMENLSN